MHHLKQMVLVAGGIIMDGAVAKRLVLEEAVLIQDGTALRISMPMQMTRAKGTLYVPATTLSYYISN